MTKPKNIILVRHGKTNVPKPGVFYGSTDIELHPNEFNELKAIELPSSIQGIYSSPKRRCLETAQLLFPNHGLETINIAKEVDFGDWEGLTFPEIEERNPELINAWSNDPEFSFPNGESIEDFKNRCEELAQVLLNIDDENIVLLCHGGVIRYLTCYFLDIDYSETYRFQTDNASFTHLKVYGEKQASLNKFNITEGFSWLKSL